MPLAGPVSEGRKFFCPRCGALYSVTYMQASKQETNIAQCVVCSHVMDKSDTTNVPVYQRMRRPEDA